MVSRAFQARPLRIAIQQLHHSGLSAVERGRPDARGRRMRAHAPEDGSVASTSIALVDASSYIYRYHHGYGGSRLTGADDHDTTVEHSMLNFLLSLYDARDQHPWGRISHVIVAFDGGGSAAAVVEDDGAPVKFKTFRRQLSDAYKANREKAPDEVQRSMADLPGIVHRMGFNSMHHEGWEADDLIATAADELTRRGSRVTIFSRDKDFQQLLQNPDVTLVRKDQGKAAQAETFMQFWEANGFEPQHYPDFQALAGDASDNIPGVKSIGVKRATALVKEFATLENMFTYVEGMKASAAIKSLQATGLKEVLTMRAMVTLHTSVRTSEGTSILGLLPYGLHTGLSPSEEDMQEAASYLQSHKMTSVLQRFRSLLGP